MTAVSGSVRHGAGRVVERELNIYRRLWRGNVFSTFLLPVVYLGAMGLGLGGLIEASGNTVDGMPYLEFVAPGLLAATVFQSASGEGMWPVMAGFKWMRFYHAMVAAPINPMGIMVGHLCALAARLSLTCVAYLVVAWLIGALASPLAPLAIPAAILGALAIAAPLSAFTMTQEDDGRFPLVLRFIVLPMFLFSGTVFPVSELPRALEVFAWFTPLWHVVELCRAATTGTMPDGGPTMFAVHVVVPCLFVAIGLLWGRRTFTEKLVS
jgi:lipooligosaccharide transport system permease protein